MDTETEEVAIVPTTEAVEDSSFPVSAGKIFVYGAALGAGLYGGKLLVDWIAAKIVFRKKATVIHLPPTPEEN